MFRKKKILLLVLSALLFVGMQNVAVRAEDELNNGLPEILTGMDEYGNVYELDTSSGYVDTPMMRTRGGGNQVVNFNTKGFSGITEYTEVSTGISGYTCGAYGADAAYLGTSGSKVRFMLAGVIGEVESSEVQVLDLSAVNILSHYVISDGRLYHKVATKLTSTSYGSTLEQGPAPSYLSAGVQYYSYDGHYFYADYGVMTADYGNNTRENSVNPDSPYFNYFQFLPLRSQSNYDGTKLNSIINGRVGSTSKMRDVGVTLVEYQDTYGINALLATGVAANESSWGTSPISQQKNNLFGLNAIDSNPGQASNYYSDVKICVKDFMETYLSKQYLNPNNWKYYGGFLGNKASGANVKYASDPYWGEKAANVAWVLDKANGNLDAKAYTVGIKDIMSHEHTALNVRKEATTSATKLYNTGTQSSHAFIILGEEKGFYKVQSDPVLNAERTAINGGSGIYRFTDMYAYASKDYITKVSNGGKISNNTSWNAADIVTNNESPQLLQSEIKLTAQVNNATSDLSYKFVWMKDDWDSWGVIKDFSAENSTIWIPEEAGTYKLYMDVKDSADKTETVIIDYEIKEWGFSGINTDLQSPQLQYTAIRIEPQIIGDNTGLQYKFVWMKDDWDAWDVICDFSNEDSAIWIPEESGEYTLYVDIQDGDGFKTSKTLEYEILDANWSLNGIGFDKDKIEVGKKVTISAEMSNPNKGLQYKFVWMKDNWNSWGVIRDFSVEDSVSWTPTEAGIYEIYVDVRDSDGDVQSVSTKYTVAKREIHFSSIELNQNSPQEVGVDITINAIVDGDIEGLEYKYVWMKDNWNSWGVIQNFTQSASCKWTPDEAGDYKIYVDVRAAGSEETVSKWVSFRVKWGTWSVAGVNYDLQSPQIPFTPIEMAARIVGNKTGLEYKFVWMKDDWDSWGVIRERSTNAKATWMPDEAGDYKLYLDVFDKSGKSVTYIASYTIEDWIIETNPLQQGKVNAETTISVDGIKHNKNLEYKFVWMKDAWDSWGVIQDFSENYIVTWTPKESGEYYLYVDIKNNATDKIESKWIYYEVK